MAEVREYVVTVLDVYVVTVLDEEIRPIRVANESAARAKAIELATKFPDAVVIVAKVVCAFKTKAVEVPLIF